MSKSMVSRQVTMTKAELIKFHLAGIPDDTKIILSVPVIDVFNGNVKYCDESGAVDSIYIPEDNELYIFASGE